MESINFAESDKEADLLARLKEMNMKMDEAQQQTIQECARASAREVLDNMIKRRDVELHGLIALSRALPMVLDSEADEALWRILISVG